MIYQLRVTSAYHWEEFVEMTISPDGAFVATASKGNLVQVWEVSTDRLVCTLTEHTSETLCVAWSPDGKLLASGGGAYDQTICLWETANWTLWSKLVGQGQQIDHLEWSSDARRLWSDKYEGVSHSGTAGKVCVWDVPTGTLIDTLPARKREKTDPPAVTHGKLRVTAVPRTALRLSEVESGTFLRDLCSPRVSEVGWSPNRNHLAVVLDGGAVQVWETATAKLLRTLDPDPKIWWGGPFWAPDGKRLATKTLWNWVKVWDTVSGELQHSFLGHQTSVLCIAWSGDGKLLATAGVDGVESTVKVWDAEGQLLQTLGMSATREYSDRYLVGHVRWSADSKRLSCLSFYGVFSEWDVSSGALLRMSEDDVERRSSRVAWSSDGRLLAASDENWKGRIRLWETAGGKLLREWERPDGFVESLAFSPDNKSLLAGYRQGEIVMWSVETGAVMETFATDLPGYRLRQVEFVAADISTAKEFGQTPYGKASIAVTTFSLPDETILSAFN